MHRFVYRVATAALFALLAFFPSGAFAESASEPTVKVPQLSAAPHLSGVIDDSWKNAARVQLGWDYAYKRPAEEATTVYIAQYGDALYLAFDAKQREPLTVTQHTNGASVYNDDHVSVAFFPQGSHGFVYIFRANAAGARDQSSSENTAYAPQWQAAGKVVSSGYDVTMRIPLNVIRAGGSHNWRTQFVRDVISDNEKLDWTHDPNEQYDLDVNYLGTLAGISGKSVSARPPARLQTYMLGEMAHEANTSRVGADFSIPITGTASFIGTLHPDYSNVETDQQSISPQEFPRFYNEVRPFFTQLQGMFNNHFSCANCPMTLYTPIIPAFSQGYAVEGTQGPATFAAFDAIGPERTDTAQTVSLVQSTKDNTGQLSLQRVSVDTPGLHDVASTIATGYAFSHNNAFVYANAGTDRGTFVTDPSQGQYDDYGFGLKDQTAYAIIDFEHVGAQFQPADGYTMHPGITGLSLFGNKEFDYSATSAIQSFNISANYDHYTDGAGHVNQNDQSVFASLRTRKEFTFGLQAGSSYLMTPSGELAPFNQNTAFISYRGNTSTPSAISYSHGRYYHGALQSWYRTATIPLPRRLTLALEVDNTSYAPDAQYGPGTSFDEIPTNQLLERATVAWQLNHEASLAVGVRRISGIFAPSGFGWVPTVGTSAMNFTNLSAAFHFLALRNEFYVVYGDPSQLATRHALFLKWIRYIGAPKGT